MIDLEAIRKALWKKANAYTDLLSAETFSAGKNADRPTVPPEWEHHQPDRFWRVVNGFQLAKEIVALHADLIRTGKAQLIATGCSDRDASAAVWLSLSSGISVWTLMIDSIRYGVLQAAWG